MIRLSWAIEALEQADADLDKIDDLVHGNIGLRLHCDMARKRVQEVIAELLGEQAEYRAKAEADNNALYGTRKDRSNL